jgi:imidazolonepropionase-like amidohydrolase
MERTIIFGGPIFDSVNARFNDGQMIVIEDERIVAVERAGGRPENGDARVIDVNGRCVIPGLIDSHFHLMSRSAEDADADLITTSTIDGILSARRTIEAGVTTVRDPGCKHRGIYRLRSEIAAGRIPGPRTFAAGPNVVGSGAPVDWRNVFADGTDAVRKTVRLERLAGADFIKLVLSHTTASSRWQVCLRYMTDEEIAAAVSEAHALGARTGCHCEGLPAARGAVAAGMDVIDHGLSLDEKLVGEMVERGTFYVPTLWAFSAKTHLEYAKTIREDQIPDYEERISGRHRESVQMAHAAGVLIGAGSDPIHWIPARDVLVKELEALVAAGLSVTEALVAATLNGAVIIGVEDTLGSLDSGKTADVVVVEGDPRTDLRALARPALVLKSGEVMLNLLSESTAAEAHWAEMATGLPASERQPEIWLERA